MTLRIVKELTGGRRNRVFAYDRYLAILNEGTGRYEDKQTACLDKKRGSAHA
jgi:hypothetical protein